MRGWLGGVATVPWRAREVEILLKDQKLDDTLTRRGAEAAFATAAQAQRIQDRAWQRLVARALHRAATHEGLSMTTAAPEPKANMGQPIPRYDAVAKVTGKAEYAADVPLARPAYAYFITSAISKGRITAMDVDEAKKLRGVLEMSDFGTHLRSSNAEPMA